jgi:hypothetical protein
VAEGVTTRACRLSVSAPLSEGAAEVVGDASEVMRWSSVGDRGRGYRGEEEDDSAEPPALLAGRPDSPDRPEKLRPIRSGEALAERLPGVDGAGGDRSAEGPLRGDGVRGPLEEDAREAGESALLWGEPPPVRADHAREECREDDAGLPYACQVRVLCAEPARFGNRADDARRRSSACISIASRRSTPSASRFLASSKCSSTVLYSSPIGAGSHMSMSG